MSIDSIWCHIRRIRHEQYGKIIDSGKKGSSKLLGVLKLLFYHKKWHAIIVDYAQPLFHYDLFNIMF